MSGVVLSEQTRLRLQAIFPADSQGVVEELLVRECGANLPLQESATPVDLERIRFAVLKLSKATMTGIDEAIKLAQDDWRDLLVAADFADDPDAHNNWKP